MNGIIVEGNTLTIGHTKIIVKYPIKKIKKKMENILFY